MSSDNIGKWEKGQDNIYYYCSNCRCVRPYKTAKFCPECGTNMQNQDSAVWEFDARTYPDTLVQLRKSKHMTQKQLAELADCSLITIVNYENGYRLPHTSVLLRIASALGIDRIVFNTNKYGY